jgi:formate dehydrogenase maturation protein FdhE
MLQEHNQLAPVVSWVSSITPKDLEPAVAYMAKVLPSRIKEAMEQHPAFGQQRALQLLQTLWLEYLLPLVAGTEEDTMQEQQEILEEVHTNLASHMQSQATSLLDKLQGTAKVKLGFVVFGARADIVEQPLTPTRYAV